MVASVANRPISSISGLVVGGPALFPQASVLFRETDEETDARRPLTTYDGEDEYEDVVGVCECCESPNFTDFEPRGRRWTRPVFKSFRSIPRTEGRNRREASFGNLR